MAQTTKESPFTKHTSEFREKAANLGQDVQELGKLSKEIAQDTVGMLRENAGDYYEQGLKKAQKLEKSFESKIRENPLRSLMIAAGVGLVVGFLWSRR